MYRVLIIACALMFVFAVAVQADPPTGPTGLPGSWGHDCTQWMNYSDPWASGLACYDPNMGGGGAGWRNCSDNAQLTWPSLDIELWIEMTCTFQWDASHVRIHRANDFSPAVIYLNGGSCCNNGQYIITTPPNSLTNLNSLPFVQDILGRTGPTYGTNIPLLWDYSLNSANYLPMLDLPDNPIPGHTSKYFLVNGGCNSWTMRITANMATYQEDGYYYLGGPGAFTCPADPM